jgi:hypothetical protein
MTTPTVASYFLETLKTTEELEFDGWDEMVKMPLDSNCGRDCKLVIDKANELIEMMLDINRDTHVGLLRAVAYQCLVFITG